MISRRSFFQHASLLAALPSASFLLAAELAKTPRMTEGPFKPVAYPGRTPHIHFAVSRDRERLLTTQLFVKGDVGNDRDGIYQSLGDRKDAVTADFAAMPESKIGELAAQFEIVVGQTPEEPDQGGPGGGRPGRPPGRGRPPVPR